MLLKFGWFVALFSVLAAGIAVAVATQTQVAQNRQTVTESKVKTAVAEEDWEGVKEQNLELLQRNPDNQKAWFLLGLARHYLTEYETSREDWLRAKALGHEPGIIHYNLACSYTKQHNVKRALVELRNAKSLGFNVHEYAKSDPDFDEIRDNPEFESITSAPN